MQLLLVEDNIRLGKLTCNALKASGFAVNHFSKAEEAEAALTVITYDAIVLDLGLPDRDGSTLLEPARRYPRCARRWPTAALVQLVLIVMNIAYSFSAYPVGVLADRVDRVSSKRQGPGALDQVVSTIREMVASLVVDANSW